MRLKKKPLRRTAAAALALGMAVSTAATPAMATYRCDISKGDVNIIIDASGNKTITVGYEQVENKGEGDDIYIYNGNERPPKEDEMSSFSADEAPAAGAPEAPKAETEAEDAPAGDTENLPLTEAPKEEASDEETPAEETPAEGDEDEAPAGKDDEAEADEPATLEIEVPEEDGQPEAGSTVTKDADGNTVIQQADTDPEPEKQATLPEAPAEEDDTSDEKERTYGGKAETKIRSGLEHVVENVIRIINNTVSTGELRVTLDNVRIGTYKGPAISVEGNVRLDLIGQNMAKTNAEGMAGIQLGGDGTTLPNELTIGGYGSLDAAGGVGGAGIGSGTSSSDNIQVNIESGDVTAKGGDGAAGIGGGKNAAGDTLVVIKGGTVHATGGHEAAGIGAGRADPDAPGPSTDVFIRDGDVTAKGGYSAAGIGASYNSDDTYVYISGGKVNATGGTSGAGIGAGHSSKNTRVYIDGGTVEAEGGSRASGIGSTYNSEDDVVHITANDKELDVTATAGETASSAISGGAAPVRLGENNSGVVKSIVGGVLTTVHNKAYVNKLSHTDQNHIWEEVSRHDPTCTDDGRVEYKCSIEGCNATSTGFIPTTGHQYSDWVVDKNATCTEPGSRHRNCVRGDDPQTEVIPARDHFWDDGVITTPPTCKTNGVKTFTCLRDSSHTKTESIPVDSTHHTGSTKVLNAKPATCTEEGYTGDVYCADCNTLLSSGTAIPANGHTEVIDKVHDATCTETGLTDGIHCSVCDTVIKAQEELPVKGHSPVTDPAVEPTCTTPGKTEGSHCSVCNTVLKAQEELPAKGHTPVIDPAVAPTETSTGLTEGSHCAVCNTVLEAQKVIPALGSSEAVTPAAPETPAAPAQSEDASAAVPQLAVLNILNRDVINDTTKVEQTYDSTRRVMTVRADLAVSTLAGTLDMLDDADTVVFITNFSTSTLRVDELIQEFGRDASFRLVHTGPVVVLLINGQPHNELLK